MLLWIQCKFKTKPDSGVIPDENAILEFKRSLRGELIQPGEEGYDGARKVYNAMIDRRPGVIAHCADVADVIAAVNFGRENNLPVSVMGDGGNFGIVTSFLFRTHPIHTDYAGPMLWEIEDAPEVMKWYLEYITSWITEFVME
jgi:hypothetical protein